jgi:phosphopantetheine--protein transferase-like protein
MPNSSISSSERPVTGEVRCGIDIEMISELPEAADYREHKFYRDSFTPEEIAYCLLQENPRLHFTARWCAKEALFKCDPAFRKEKMTDVEVARSEQGDVFLRHRVNGSNFTLPHSVSLSHTNALAAAVVVKTANGSSRQRGIGPGQPLPQSGSTGTSAAADDGPFPVLGVLAWMVSLGVAILALLRTFR